MKVKLNQGEQLLVLSLLLLLPATCTFLKYSQGMGWDLPGHIAEADIYRNEILPDVYGYNPYFLFGYPIHLYPPLSRILLALFSYALGTVLAAKLLLAFGVLCSPLALHFMLRKNGYDSFPSACACVLFSAFFATAAQSYEVSIKNAYYLGLFSYYSALPLVFLAIAYFNENRRFSAALSALALLFNTMLGAAAIAFSLALSANSLLSRKWKQELSSGILYALLLLLICAWWIAPFAEETIAKGNAGYHIPFDIGKIRNENLAGLAAAAVAFFLSRNRQKGAFLAVLFFALLAARLILPSAYFGQASWFEYSSGTLGCIAVAMLFFKKDRFFTSLYAGFLLAYFSATLSLVILSGLNNAFLLPIVHAYRVSGFISVLDFAAIGLAAASLLGKRAGIACAALAAILCAAACVSPSNELSFYLHQDEAPYSYNFSGLQTGQGRAIMAGNLDPGMPHTAYDEYFMQTGKPTVRGLFVEQAISSYFASPLSRKISGIDTFDWGLTSAPFFGGISTNYPIWAAKYADLAGVSDAIVSPSAYRKDNYDDITPLSSNFRNASPIKANGGTLLHFKLGDFQLADARPAYPICEKDWKQASLKWFSSIGSFPSSGKIPVGYQSCDSARAFSSGNNPSVQVLKYSAKKISLFVGSKDEVPVFIKQAYSPNWVARGPSGALQVYRATPEFMLVFGKGAIELEYRAPWHYYLLLLLSCLAFAWAVCSGTQHPRRNK